MTDKLKHSRLFLWFIQVLRVCGRELLLVFRDSGVVIFFVVLNLAYPVLYALIYNPEVVRNERVVVVDDNHPRPCCGYVWWGICICAHSCGYWQSLKDAFPNSLQ